MRIRVEDDRKRLDAYLAEKLKGKFSRSQIKRFIKEQRVLVDKKLHKPGYIVDVGQIVEIGLPSPQESKIKPENIPLDIVYEDNEIIVGTGYRENKEKQIRIANFPATTIEDVKELLSYLE